MKLDFFRADIRAVFNLEKPDEHLFCGHGNHSSGFSYDPSEFMDVGSRINHSIYLSEVFLF